MGGSGGLISKVVGAGLMIAGLFTGGVTSAMGMALMATRRCGSSRRFAYL